MSKSYKRFPIIRQEKVDKKLSNKRIRHFDEDYCLRGGQYKKVVSNCWKWEYPWFFEDAMDLYENCERTRRLHLTKEDYINYWKRCCYRK